MIINNPTLPQPASDHPHLCLRLILGALLLVVSAGASGNDEVREIDEFSRVQYMLPYSVEFVVSDVPFVELQGDPQGFDEIITRVRNGELKISQSRSWLSWLTPGTDSLHVTVGYTNLDSIVLNSSGDGYAGELEGDRLKLAVRGSGNLQAELVSANDLHVSTLGSGDISLQDVDVDTLHSQVKGSGNIHMRGNTNNLKMSILGSGDQLADKLRAQETELSVQGSGDASIWSELSLQVSIMGSGDVTYYGNPQLTQSILGSGQLKPARH